MSARASRRQVLAAIALQIELPMPESVEFCVYEQNGQVKHYIRLDLASIADLRVWLPVFGMTEKSVSTQPYTHKTGPETGRTTTLANALRHDNGWRGWNVGLTALDPVDEPEPALDDATREQLAAVAAGETGDAPAAAHYMTTGWCGVPGQCGVECACGVGFDGFDTIAEAAALLDNHIAAEAMGGASC